MCFLATAGVSPAAGEAEAAAVPTGTYAS